MRVWVLGSGSSGNAVLVESAGTRVLVDAGFGPRTLTTRLKVAGVHPGSIQACIVTHEHTDHTWGVAAAVRRWGWRVFASHGTASGAARELGDTPVQTFAAGERLSVGDLDIATMRVPHDATEPVGVVVTARASGVRAGICYDIGHASDTVRSLCRELDVLVLESNHDEGMLRAGPYPPFLQRRIAGGSGHLGNRQAAELARDSASAQLGHVVLAHLSEKNNTPEIARRSMATALARTAFRGELTVARQDAVVGPFGPRAFRAPAVEQFSLF